MDDTEGKNKYLTDKAIAYEPTKEEIKFYHKNNQKSLRYIFCGQELDSFEKEKLQGLKEYINNVKQKEMEQQKDNGSGELVPETYETLFKGTVFDDDNYVLRFLQGLAYRNSEPKRCQNRAKTESTNEFNYEKCYGDMVRHLEWRKENLPVNYDDVKDILNNGYIYVHGRDKQMHPIIVINCKNFITANAKDVLKVAYYWMEFIISKLFIEGKIEQWRVIIDLTSCGVLNIPLGTLKDISRCLSCNYRSRLSKMLVLSAPLFVSGMWHMLKSIIPVVTQQKITITSSEIDKKLLDQVDLDQLEKKFGGTCDNTSMFSEPIMP
ncbi:CRAL/TRIO domain-containing protein, putative [Plasmodium ovale]|uniref:CRAL/TRIO domain-containing protein, putative n=1 Tax=Plasmodium ovale TaxID=36330 RepID=A0A1D3TI47_PLAOA|nr:CRAL/TRIO domain-containing protein, putative [Plasmodium ovale]